MPIVNGKEVLRGSPEFQATRNARGGIDKTSNREAQGLAPKGSTGTIDNLEIKPDTASLATTSTPRDLVTNPAPSTFNVNVPTSIKSDALGTDITTEDVFARRNQLDQQQGARKQFDTDFGNLMGKVQAPLQASPFQNPEQFINETLLRRPTNTAQELNTTQQQQAQGFRDIGAGLEQTRQDLTDEFGLTDLRANQAETRNRIAERTTKLRQDIRDFEVNAAERGVPREFAQAEKQKIQADAAAELADLAIIESAQTGNIQLAQEDIDRALNQKIQAFEFENMAIQTEIKRLEGLDSKESQARSEQLQIALTERNRNIEQAVADEKSRLNYLSEAAANGADQGTLDAIRNAATPGEAALLAGPFIGRLDRTLKQAQINSADRANQPGEKLRQTAVIEQNGVKMLIDEQTGEVIKEFGAGEGGSLGELQQMAVTTNINATDALKFDKGMARAVGVRAISRWTPFSADEAEYTNFIASVDNLTKGLTLDQLASAKERGITFGALSEGELGLIADAASKINNWRVEEDGKTTFFKASEADFKKELDKISNYKKLDAVLKGVPPESIGVQVMEDGTIWTTNSDGTLAQLR